MAHDLIATHDKQSALNARYGADSVPTAGPWNATIQLLLAHRSVRSYKPDKVPAKTFETLIAAAQSAATSSNMQTWSVIAVRDPGRKSRLAALSSNQKHIEQCPLFLIWLADISRNDRLGQSEGVKLETLAYHEAFLVAAVDAALAAQNAVIAAESLGLSTVYIGSLRNRPIEVAAELNLPKGAMGMFGLCVGYASDSITTEVKPRLPQDAIAFSEQYSIGNEPEMRSRYDAKLAAFSKRNEMNAYTWTERVITRMAKTSSLGGRDQLVAALQAVGFPLR